MTNEIAYDMNNYIEQKYQSGELRFTILMGFFQYSLNLESFTMVRVGFQGSFPLQRMVI
jgi:hypothetical protein